MSRQYTLQRAPVSTSVHIEYAAELNEQQLAAVTALPGPLLVIAGAGSGKTRTLTYRVAYLLENGIDPRNVLLLTFTNKAAREMLNRVANLLPVDASGLWGGTFHSVGNRILRRHGTALGYSSGFTIMDREDQKDLINTVVASAGIDPKEIDCLIVGTVTPDMFFPSTANIVCDKVGATNAWGFDLAAACSGFLFSLTTGAALIESGR